MNFWFGFGGESVSTALGVFGSSCWLVTFEEGQLVCFPGDALLGERPPAGTVLVRFGPRGRDGVVVDGFVRGCLSACVCVREGGKVGEALFWEGVTPSRAVILGRVIGFEGQEHARRRDNRVNCFLMRRNM